jgi:hypothetical protein
VFKGVLMQDARTASEDELLGLQNGDPTGGFHGLRCFVDYSNVEHGQLCAA